MLEDKLQFLIKKGLLRKKHPKWIFKSDLLKLGEEIQYKINITIDELRGPLYAALMQQSSALTLMYCAELIESQGSQSLKSFLERIERDGGKAHRSLLNDNRIKEVQALLNSLKIDHPKTRYLVELLKQHYSFYNEKKIIIIIIIIIIILSLKSLTQLTRDQKLSFSPITEILQEK